MKPCPIFLKTLLLLIFPLFLACDHSGGQGQDMNNKEHNNSTKEPEPNSQLPEAFKDFKVLELPINIEKATNTSDNDALEQVGIDFQEETSPFRNIFITNKNVFVGIKCYRDEFIASISFAVLDKTGNTLGETIDVNYYSGGNLGGFESKIEINNDFIIVKENEYGIRYEADTTATISRYKITSQGINKSE